MDSRRRLSFYHLQRRYQFLPNDLARDKSSCYFEYSVNLGFVFLILCRLQLRRRRAIAYQLYSLIAWSQLFAQRNCTDSTSPIAFRFSSFAFQKRSCPNVAVWYCGIRVAYRVDGSWEHNPNTPVGSLPNMAVVSRLEHVGFSE